MYVDIGESKYYLLPSFWTQESFFNVYVRLHAEDFETSVRTFLKKKVSLSPLQTAASVLLFSPCGYHSLVFCSAALLTKCADGWNIRFEPLLLGRVSPWCELDECVERNLHPGGFLLGNIHVISVNASQHGLMGHDDNILAPFKLHDDRLEADDDVAVALAATVPVVVLVVVPSLEVLRIPIRDLLIRQAVTHTGIQLIQRLPFKLIIPLR